jgi:hypothetical protein
VTALRGQMAQASQVVQTTQQQDGAAATQIRSLKYPKDAPAVPLDTTTTSPTPTPTTEAPMPECDIDEVAKTRREIDDFKMRYTRFLDDVKKHPQKSFDIDDPKQLQEAKIYEKETQRLKAERAQLISLFRIRDAVLSSP